MSWFSSASATHVSGGIFIWPSTIRLNELERIIHSSIISLPLCSPLLSNLLAFPALPQLQRFIPVAAAICIRPIVAHWLQERKDEIGTAESEIRSAQVTVQTQNEESVKGAMQTPDNGLNICEGLDSFLNNMEGCCFFAYILRVLKRNVSAYLV